MIPFNKPHTTGREFEFIREAIAAAHLAGHGRFTQMCQQTLEKRFKTPRALLTHSCTAALEMAALLSGVGDGDEVIMPSFTFVSTANAFVLRGARPVFVDIRPDTQNIDELLIERAITTRTKAIVVVHYAGVACDMDAVMDIANRHGLLVIEDAAQAFGSSWRGAPLGSIGHLGALSFHETKNVISGEGGALLVNDARFVERAEILWEKGTDRVRFQRGSIRRYTWVDLGSSYLPSEITAAFLWAQLDAADSITDERLRIWEAYHGATANLPVSRPHVPDGCVHNAHMYYVLVPAGVERSALLSALNAAGVNAVFHYVPLHSSPAGARYGRAATPMTVTDEHSARLIRLPLWVGMDSAAVATVVQTLEQVLAAVPHP